MKQLSFLIALFAISILTMSACNINYNGISPADRLPLVSYPIENNTSFTGITNSTVIDIEFIQAKEHKIELFCPKDYDKYVVIQIEGNSLKVTTSKGLSNKKMNEVNQHLAYSKLHISAPTIKDITVNGSSTLAVNSNIHTTNLTATLNGSGDINFNNVHSTKNIICALNGSGDINFNGEVVAEDVMCKLNGSGDINHTFITSHNLNVSLNGSGDIDIKRLVAVNSSLNLAGSGDINALNILSNEVKAELIGSGDIKLKGKCDNAILMLTNSGTMEAKDLVATNVVANVTGSGIIKCNAQNTLQAKATGSGEIKYCGNPELTLPKKEKVIKMN